MIRSFSYVLSEASKNPDEKLRQPLAFFCQACKCTIVDAAGDLCPSCETRRNLSRGQQSLAQSRLEAFGCPATTSEDEAFEKWQDLNERAEFEVAQFTPYQSGREAF